MRIILLCFVFLFGISNSSNAQLLKKVKDKLDGRNQTVDNDPIQLIAADKTATIPAAFKDYFWFKKNASLIYRIHTMEPRADYMTQYTIKNIYNDGDATISQVEIKTSKNNVHIDDGASYTEYKCTADQLFYDITTPYKEEMKKRFHDVKINSGKYAERSGNEGFVSIPLALSAGQKLDPASYTLTSPDGTVTWTTSLSDRKVEDYKETITMQSGKYECYKISGLRTNTITDKDITKNKTETLKEYVWVAPKAGIVKQETYDQKGNLKSIFFLYSVQ